MLNTDELLKEVLKNNRVAEKVSELKLTKDQMKDALATLIDMANEVDDGSLIHLTTIFVDDYGIVRRTTELASRGKKLSYLENIVSQQFNEVDYEKLPEFHKDEGRKEVVNEFAKFIQGETNNKGLYIYGDMGIGKTYMLKTFTKKLAQANKKVAYVNLSNLTMKVKSTFNEEGDTTGDLLKILTDVDYLLVDDIGSEKITSWFRDDFLFILFNERLEKGKTTFFSSNYSTEELIKKEAKTSNSKYSEYDNAKRLISRIRGLAKEYKIEGTNKRY